MHIIDTMGGIDMFKRMAIQFILMLAAVLLMLPHAGICISTDVSYQGKLTDSSGQPLPDGTYSLVFKLYGTETSATPYYTSSPVSVTTRGGIFSTGLSLPSYYIDLYSNNLWIETVIDSQPLSPRNKLHTVPYAMRATRADTVADGSITEAKLSGDMGHARAPYLMGVDSGYSATDFTIKIDDIVQPKGTVLAAQFSMKFDVIKQPIGLVSGTMSCSGLTLRRPVSSDRKWLDWAINTSNDPEAKHDVEIAMVVGKARVAWRFTQGPASSYNIRLSDNGLPVEEITFEYDPDNVTREQVSYTECRPGGSGVQVGFEAPSQTGEYYPVIDREHYRELVVATDAVSKSGVYTTNDVNSYGKAIYRKIVSPSLAQEFKIRQCPLSASPMWDWFSSFIRNQEVLKNVLLYINGTSDYALTEYVYAWPYTYTLMLADDGLPVEEYTMSSRRMLLPQ